MAKTSAGKNITLSFPALGLDRQHSFQQQPPYSTPNCQNVRPVETNLRRQRGGSRPGLGKAFYDLLASGNPLRMMTSLTVVKNDGLVYFSEDFSGTVLGSVWTAASWLSGAPGVVEGGGSSVSYGTTAVGAVRDALSINTASAYDIELFIAPFQGSHHGEYTIFARMADATPVATTLGMAIKLVLATDGSYSGNLITYGAGGSTYAFSTGTKGVTAGWLRVNISARTVTVTWQGTTILTQDIGATSHAALTGKRIGFGENCTNAGGICLVRQFRCQYYNADLRPARKTMLMPSSNGILYRENALGQLGVAQSSPRETLATDRLLLGQDRGQSLYIADNGVALSGTDGLQGTGPTKFDSTAVTDWTAAIVVPVAYDYVLVISNATLAMINGTYVITAVAAGELTTSPACNAGAGTCSWRIERGPKVYEDVNRTMIMMTASTGQVPTGCPLICLYRDRIVLGGPLVSPHMWFMSRQGTPLDWDYAQTDAKAAVYGSSADAGQIGEPLTCLIPHNDDYMVMGCRDSLWVLRGDPTFGGQIDNLSRSVGIVDKRAYCKGPAGEIIFLSRDGLYALAPGAGSFPTSISRERLPRELIDVDANMYTVSMEYDARDRGVHVFLASEKYKGAKHWWFDWQTRGFFPVLHASEHEPTAMCYHSSEDAPNGGVMFGCRDGYIRRYDDVFELDDQTAISSNVWFGPILLGDMYYEGILSELVAVLARGSGSVTWALYVGETPEEAYNATTAFASGTWTEGLNIKAGPRARGHCAYLKLSGVSRAWEMERITAISLKKGKQRGGA